MGMKKNKRKSGVTFYRRDCDCGIPTPPMSPDFAGPSHVLFSADDEDTPTSGTVDPAHPTASDDKAISESANVDNHQDNATSASPSGDSIEPETITDSPSGDNTDLISLYTDTDSASVYSEQTISSEEQTICDSPSGDNSALISLYANLPSDDEDLKMTSVPGIIVTSPTQDALPTPPASPILEVAMHESKLVNEYLPVPQLGKPQSLPVIVKDKEPMVIPVVDGRWSIPTDERKPKPVPVLFKKGEMPVLPTIFEEDEEEELPIVPIVNPEDPPIALIVKAEKPAAVPALIPEKPVQAPAITADESIPARIIISEEPVRVIKDDAKDAKQTKRARRQQTLHNKPASFTLSGNPPSSPKRKTPATPRPNKLVVEQSRMEMTASAVNRKNTNATPGSSSSQAVTRQALAARRHGIVGGTPVRAKTMSGKENVSGWR
ncbi:hypothetical protein OE88DRAFT_800820 [Heliocybe sulcata]|uniref:Uncharacterized protein n=1 Tax=Heliocybe sulcata TaxID=5364 RepID=A0A5C3MRE7_9AGAM|nr:hypothetical protein OE88DRAFT_800820 [Heliocybe sulcata]